MCMSHMLTMSTGEPRKLLMSLTTINSTSIDGAEQPIEVHACHSEPPTGEMVESSTSREDRPNDLNEDSSELSYHV